MKFSQLLLCFCSLIIILAPSSYSHSSEIIKDAMIPRDQAEKFVADIISKHPGNCTVDTNTSQVLSVFCLDSGEGWIGLYWKNGQFRIAKLSDQEAAKIGYKRVD